MFKIGEFSKLTQVTVRMLRYYDEAGLLKPAVIDPWTGYRMYSAEQIPALNKIIYLRDSGFTVSEIAAVLGRQENHSHSTEYMTEILNKKYAEIENHIKEEQAKLQKIEIAKHELCFGTDELHYQISIKSVPSYQVLSLRRVIPDYYAEGMLWSELSEFVKEHNIEVSTNTFSIYHDQDYREKEVDVELCVTVKQFGKNKKEFTFRHIESVPNMACMMVYGDFSNIAKSYQRFAGWLSGHSQYKMSGTSRQIVHRGPWNEEDPENYLIELQIPLSEL